jgi:tetratricopeptide (TPR) repeat protein
MRTRQKKPVPESAAQTKGVASWRAKLRSPILISLALAIITVAVFWPVARHDFVNYDDPDYVTANSHVQNGLSWANVVWAFKTGHASNWHPLTWLSHIADCQMFGQQAGAHHLVNLAFHAANTVLLFLVLRRMTGAVWRSALVAALFALHPAHVESVAWISERKDVLSTLFFILTIGAFDAYAKAPPSTARSSRTTFRVSTYYILSLALFACGLMSKPMLVTLPFVLLLLDYWPLQRFQFSSLKSPASNNLRLLLEKLPFLLLSVISSTITFIVQRKGGAVSTSLPLPGRLANALVSYARYLGDLFWPRHLSVLYPHPGAWPLSQVIASATLIVALSVAVVVLARKQPWLAVGWFWFVGTLVPVIGLVQVGVQSMADRYTYVPFIGLFMALAWGLGYEAQARTWRSRALAVGAIVCLLSCAFATSRQLGYWQDSATLFGHAVKVTRDNYLAYNNLGFYLSGQGKIKEAMENYQKSLQINPNYEDAQNNVGYALAGQKQYAEAITHYEAALRVRPNHVEVRNNLGNALADIGRIDEAIEQYRFVLSRAPEHADAHNNLGIALAMKGQLDEAIEHFHAAIRSKPGYASAHSNLGNALAVQHKPDEAIREYELSLSLNPKDPQAHNNLANALAEQGKLEEAVGHYREALQLNADNPEAHFNLGLTLARQGKRDEAIAHYTEALRLKPDYAEARKELEALTPAGPRPP